jgi:hypothetical protein
MANVMSNFAGSHSSLASIPTKWPYVLPLFIFSLALASMQPPAAAQDATNNADAARAARDAEKQQAIVVDKLEVEVQSLKRQAEELKAVARSLRSDVRQKSGLSPENVAPILLGLERDRFALAIEVKLKSARQASIAELVAKQTAAAQKRANADDVAAHLQRIAQIRRDMLAAEQDARKANAVSQNDLHNAQAEADEAEIRLALRKEELAKSDGGTEIDKLNRQLLETSVGVSQDELRLSLLKQRLDVLDSVEGLLDQYKNVTESELPRVLRLLEQAEIRLAQAKASM